MMQQTDTRVQGTLIQSVQRAAALLKAFDQTTPELGVSELSRKVNLHKSTVSRLLATLEREGLVERVAGTEKYRLGFELVRMAGQVTHFGDIRSVARPILLALAESSAETVHLAVLDGDEVINIEQISGPHLIRDTNWVGRRTQLHCVANGKALLAYQDPEMIEHILHSVLPRYTERTIIDPEQLRIELEGVRASGYAVAVGEIEHGLNAVAAAVRDSNGRPAAAISISGPSYRMPYDRLPELGRQAIGAAIQIEERLDFSSTHPLSSAYVIGAER